MPLESVRRLVIIAMFSDDVLMEKLVLKGGNALDIVHRLGGRTSLDIDLSIEGDFQNFEEIEMRIFAALRNRFDSEGISVFDEKFIKKPEVVRPGQDPSWGGYAVQFKLIEKVKQKELGDSIEKLRRNATIVGPQQQRIFTIDISKHEFCGGKLMSEIDDYTIYVYTLPMIAIEKLRAICQQLDEYKLRGYQSPRARDFYDIHTIATKGGVTLPSSENFTLLRNIFAAKLVPIDFLLKIDGQREFHRQDWASVVNSVQGNIKSFDFYFDFVIQIVISLQTFRVE